jgi:hypothetical protein
VARVSGLKATRGVLEAGSSKLNPHRGAYIIARGAQRPPVKVADFDKPSKGAVKSAATPFQGLAPPRYSPSMRSTHRYYFAPSQEVQVAFKLRS